MLQSSPPPVLFGEPLRPLLQERCVVTRPVALRTHRAFLPAPDLQPSASSVTLHSDAPQRWLHRPQSSMAAPAKRGLSRIAPVRRASAPVRPARFGGSQSLRPITPPLAPPPRAHSTTFGVRVGTGPWHLADAPTPAFGGRGARELPWEAARTRGGDTAGVRVARGQDESAPCALACGTSRAASRAASPWAGPASPWSDGSRDDVAASPTSVRTLRLAASRSSFFSATAPRAHEYVVV